VKGWWTPLVRCPGTSGARARGAPADPVAVQVENHIAGLDLETAPEKKLAAMFTSVTRQ